MKKWKFPYQRLKTLSLGALRDGADGQGDDIVQSENVARSCYNLDTSGGTIKTPPLFRKYSTIFSYRVRTLTDFYGNDDKEYIIVIDADGTLIRYEKSFNMFVKPNTKTIVQTSMFEGVPNVIKYRLQGKNVLIFADQKNKLIVYDGENPPVEYESAPRVRSMAIHSERLFVTDWDNPLCVWFSDDLDPTNWDLSLSGAGFIELTGDLGKVNKIISFASYAYAFREFGITRIFADGNQQNFSVTNLHTSGGRIYGDTVTLCGERILFCSSDGIFSFDRYNTTRILKKLEGIVNAKENSIASYFKGKYFFTGIYDPDFLDSEYLGCESEYGDGFNFNALVTYDVNKNKFIIYRGIDVSRLCAMNYIDTLILVESEKPYYYAEKDGSFMDYTYCAKWYMPTSVFGYPNKKKTLKSLSFYHEGKVEIELDVDGVKTKYEVEGKSSERKFCSLILSESGYSISMTVKLTSLATSMSLPTFTYY